MPGEEDVQVDSSVVIQVLQDELAAVNSRLVMAISVGRQMRQERNALAAELDAIRAAQALPVNDVG